MEQIPRHGTILPPSGGIVRSLDAGTADATPEASPPDPDPYQTYVTDLLLSFGGSEDGTTLTVRSHRDAPDLEEAIHVTPYEDDGNDVFEVGADIDWSASDTEVDLQMLDGPTGLTTSPTFDVDCLDTEKCPTEPSATVTACDTNDCPQSATNCPQTVCVSALVVGIVDISGEWSWTGYNLPQTAKVLQGGRFIVVPNLSTVRGIIIGDHVEIRDDTRHYDGVISPDRQHMSGSATDVYTDTDLGPWSADRIAP